MLLKTLKHLTVMLIIIGSAVPVMGAQHQPISFADDFEKGLGKWDLVNGDKIQIIDSADPQHGKVMCLHSGGEAVYALIKGSEAWTGYRIEGDLLFPWNTCSYLGLIYNYNVRGPRTDFGSIFILGPFGEDLEPYYANYRKYLQWPPDHFMGNVVWVNPHRDSNASRNIYGEYWVTLTGDNDTVKPRQWGHFKAEVLGPVCHFYVNDMETPKVTFDYYEFSSGRVGFKPRYSGAEVWIDNIKAAPLKELSYKGPRLPAGITYKPEKLITRWDFIGPFSSRVKEIEEKGCLAGQTYPHQDETYRWQPLKTDPRGCVVTGMINYRFNYRYFVYFHTEIESPAQKEVTLEFSSTDSLDLWVNNEPAGNVKPYLICWHDFWENPQHEGVKIKVTLKPGKNQVIILAKTPSYGGDGFYAYCNWNDNTTAPKK